MLRFSHTSVIQTLDVTRTILQSCTFLLLIILLYGRICFSCHQKSPVMWPTNFLADRVLTASLRGEKMYIEPLCLKATPEETNQNYLFAKRRRCYIVSEWRPLTNWDHMCVTVGGLSFWGHTVEFLIHTYMSVRIIKDAVTFAFQRTRYIQSLFDRKRCVLCMCITT